VAPTQLTGSPWQSAWNTTTSPKLAPTAGSFAVGVGDLVVVELVVENDTTAPPATPSNAAASPATITWTLRQDVNPDARGGAWCGAAAWTGVVTGAGNVQASVAMAGALNYGIIVYGYPASGHGGVGQTQKGNGSTAPSIAPPSPWTAHSAVLCANGDWNAAANASPTYLTNVGTATQRNDVTAGTAYTTEAWEHADSGASPGSGAVGMGTSQKWSMVAVEVLAPSAPVDNTTKPALPGEWSPQLRPEEWF
jgi:hypothetical protein